MTPLDILATIEAEMQAHRDALARLGRVRADIAKQIAATPTQIIAPVDSAESRTIIATK